MKGSLLRHGGGGCVVRVPMAAVLERERGFNRRDCLVVEKSSRMLDLLNANRLKFKENICFMKRESSLGAV